MFSDLCTEMLTQRGLPQVKDLRRPPERQLVHCSDAFQRSFPAHIWINIHHGCQAVLPTEHVRERQCNVFMDHRLLGMVPQQSTPDHQPLPITFQV